MMSDPYGEKTVLTLDCINIDILVLILLYYIVLQDATIGGNQVNGTQACSVLFLKTASESTSKSQ